MNMIQSAKEQVARLTADAYAAAAAAGELPAGVETPVAVEIPKDAANGDYTTTFCLAAAKAMHTIFVFISCTSFLSPTLPKAP